MAPARPPPGARGLAGPGLEPQIGLTRRELEVLSLVARGDTNSAIGHRLEISPRTVQKHLQRAFRKLGVRTRTAAVARAAELLSSADVRRSAELAPGWRSLGDGGPGTFAPLPGRRGP